MREHSFVFGDQELAVTQLVVDHPVLPEVSHRCRERAMRCVQDMMTQQARQYRRQRLMIPALLGLWLLVAVPSLAMAHRMEGLLEPVVSLDLGSTTVTMDSTSSQPGDPEMQLLNGILQRQIGHREPWN